MKLLVHAAWACALSFLSTLALAQATKPASSGNAATCETRFEQCRLAVNRVQCDNPFNTSDRREACYEGGCQSALDSCNAKQGLDEKILREIEKAGGVKPAKCPVGYWIDGENKKFGTFTCARFPNGNPKEAGTYVCPPWLIKVSDHPAMFSCDRPRK